jgi:hypothetical protein
MKVGYQVIRERVPALLLLFELFLGRRDSPVKSLLFRVVR